MADNGYQRSSLNPETRQKGYYPGAEPDVPDMRRVRMFVNRGFIPTRGKLLLVSQGDNTLYCMDPKTGEFEFVFQLYDTQGACLFRAVANAEGEIYCTVTGARYKHDDRGVLFGVGGGIFKINARHELIDLVPRSTEMKDPCGLQLLANGDILVTDFDGFHGENASICQVEPSTGKRKVLCSGGELNIPIGAYLDEKAQKLYVANAIMHYEYPDEPKNDTGNILRYDLPNPQPVDFVPRAVPPQGAVLGINGDPDSNEVVMVTCGAPMFRVGALIAVNKKTAAKRTVLGADEKTRRFFSPHSEIEDGKMYVADSYQKQLLVIDLSSGKIVNSHSLVGILGAYKGVKQQFDIVDCVSVIPEQW